MRHPETTSEVSHAGQSSAEPLRLVGTQSDGSLTLARLAAQAPAVIFALDGGSVGETRLRYISAGCERMWGVPSQAARRDFTLLLSRMDSASRRAFAEALSSAAKNGGEWMWEGRCQVGRQQRWLRAQLRPRQGAGPACWVGTFVDVTEQKATELALEQALRDAAERAVTAQLRADACHHAAVVDEETHELRREATRREHDASLRVLADGVAHELNNPLAGILYLFELLQSNSLSPQRHAQYLESIQAGLTRMASTVSSLLQYADPHPAQLRPLRWSTVVHSALVAVEASLRHKNIRIRRDLTHQARGLRGDAAQLGRALGNVLRNAVDAAPPGSEVELVAVGDETREGLQVRDTGAGIPPQLLHRVCHPFFTTKRQGDGAGLGLALASNIMLVHGGILQVDSQEHVGTTVTLWLPRGKVHVQRAS